MGGDVENLTQAVRPVCLDYAGGVSVVDIVLIQT